MYADAMRGAIGERYSMTDVLWSRLTASELNAHAKADAIVLLPVASTEQHGPHMGTGVDTVLCGEVCQRTAELVSASRPIVVAPVLWMGLAEHHVALGGTFTLSLATWHAVLRELCQSIRRAGFTKICIVNGHGGNMAALAALTTDLTRELDLPIATTSYWNLPHETGAFAAVLERQQSVQHACEAETSMMLAVAPDCVRVDQLANAVGPEETIGGPMGAAMARPVTRWRAFKDVTPNGILGDARCATGVKGEALLNSAARLLADHLIAGHPWKT
jgi:creatinine amidohydrolase